jgi:signal transduction histidine kinase
MSERLPFKISSALKNLIGKELITDEFVAVFELVKNAFDANANKVEIIFDNQLDTSTGKIIIKDDGKGMDYDDLTNKWLFVAYSAKKDGTENDDYRDRIKVNRVFAGAKGVGRFSCDRLGKRLKLVSVKDGEQNKSQQIIVNWEDFEEDPKEEFINVKVTYSDQSNTSGLAHGTILEIEGLRDNWDRDRLLKLKKSLAKLINPNQGNDSKNFSIEIIAESERSKDKESAERDSVNGPINNQIFESLKIKTTSLVVEISQDGKEIKSTLEDRGDVIYVLREKNPFFQHLHDIKIHLFQLNFAAKSAFKREMGIESVKYGSVFLYKNGFRVYPFGEQGEDLLLIDRRKQQGYNRFLGTRDIIGRIEINGPNPRLTETTSRDGGLVKTETYQKLVDFFYDYVLFRLENYAVNIIKWGDEKIDKETGEIHPELWPTDVKIQILELITGFIKSDNVISIDYDKDFLNIIESKQDKSVEKIIKNISRIGANSNNPAIVKEAAKIGKVVKEIKSDSERKEKENVRLKEEKAQTDEKLKYTIGQNLFLSDSVKADTKELQSLLHHTEKSTYWINKFIENLIKGIDQGVPKEKLFETIGQISWENQKIFSFTKYHKSTQFNTFVDKIDQDIIAFINQYVNNVIKFYEEYEKLDIDIITPHGLTFVKNFSPVDIPIIIDNLLNNSQKAGARKIIFEWKSVTPNSVSLIVQDNGKGVEKSTADNIFDFRFTTTKGSGLGLYHAKKVINQLNGEITVNDQYSGGAQFIITFKK